MQWIQLPNLGIVIYLLNKWSKDNYMKIKTQEKLKKRILVISMNESPQNL